MVLLILGLVLFVLGLTGFLVSFFGSSIDYAHRSTEILNWDVNAGTLVMWGAVSTLLMVLGLWLLNKARHNWWRQSKEDRASRKLGREVPAAPADDAP